MRTALVSALLSAALLAIPSPRGGRPPPAKAGGPGADPPRSDGRSRAPVVVTEEARNLHREALVVDGHNDLPWALREQKDLSFQTIDLRKGQSRRGLHTDIPRLRQ